MRYRLSIVILLLVLILLLGAYINPRFMPKLVVKDGISSESPFVKYSNSLEHTIKDGNSSELIVNDENSSKLIAKNGTSSEMIEDIPSADNLNNVRVCMARTGATDGGYVMGWDFHEGQTCAARNFLGLIDWACDLNLTVVEPCVYNSFFNMANCIDMLSQTSNSKRPLTFRDYFDIDHWNNQLLSHEIGAPLLAWKDFTKRMPKEAIIVYSWAQSGGKQASVFIDDEIKKDAQQCYHVHDHIKTRPQFTKQMFSKLDIKITREVCFKYDIFTPIDLQWFNRQILGNCNASDVLILFTYWAGVFNGRMLFSKAKYQHREASDYLKPSPNVVEHSKKYSQRFLGEDKYVGVHIRAIKISIALKDYLHRSNEQIVNFLKNDCSQQVSTALQGLEGKRFLAVDLGKFGDFDTGTIHFANDSVNKIISNLLTSTYGKDTWNQSQWEDSFVQANGGITDSGYVAMMQKVLVSNAKCVVTAGDGEFHNTLMKEYKEYTKNPCMHEVCKPK